MSGRQCGLEGGGHLAMRSKKLEPGLSLSPAGTVMAVAWAGAVRVDEGAACWEGGGGGEREDGGDVAEARVAVRVVMGWRGW